MKEFAENSLLGSGDARQPRRLGKARVPLTCLGGDQAAKQRERKNPHFHKEALLENLLINRVGSTAILKPPSLHPVLFSQSARSLGTGPALVAGGHTLHPCHLSGAELVPSKFMRCSPNPAPGVWRRACKEVRWGH